MPRPGKDVLARFVFKQSRKAHSYWSFGVLSGRWTYRSFRNDPKLVGDDSAAALALIFGEGVFDFEAEEDGLFRGGLGMAPGYALALTGKMEGAGLYPQTFAINGEGLSGTPTDGWRYDYRGIIGYPWPDAKGQVPALLGTVIRSVAHGSDAPAGYTASFIAVRQSEADRPRPVRASALTEGL